MRERKNRIVTNFGRGRCGYRRCRKFFKKARRNQQYCPESMGATCRDAEKALRLYEEYPGKVRAASQAS